ncbi:MAG TPA: F0F1 ATP synthase subunit delta [Propionibacteriaceae bacterium]|nr:F0F1 ATP synthase subunit delta [Propionibacteriaceae bacterium]
MSLDEDTRISALDEVLDTQQRGHVGLVGRLLRLDADTDSLGHDLFGVVDALDSSAALRRALSDPGSPADARRRLAGNLLKGKVSEEAVNVVAEASAMRWAGGRALVAALERQAVRAELLQADQNGQLEETEDELFRFARLVESSPELREAMSDRGVGIAHRQELVSQLLTGKVSDTTVRLAKRAVAARERTFAHTIEGYVNLAAAQKNRLIATVRVARPLTEEQTTRLRAALGRQAGREVFVQVVVDPEIVGGVRVELGDEVIEGSVAARLTEARRLFS